MSPPSTPAARPTRRAVLSAALAGGACALLPGSLLAAPDPSRRRRTLVTLHLVGGNDGLNTVAPVGDARYRRLRPALALRPDEVLGLGRGLGLHPALGGLARLLERDRLAVVEGVGYPQPDLSHFRSTEVWYTGEPARAPRDGWLGRALKARGGDAPVRAVALARETPLSFAGSTGIATFRDFSELRLPPSLADVGLLYRAWGSHAGPRGEVGRAGAEALDAARRIASLQAVPLGFEGALAKDLGRALALVEAGLDLEAIHLTFGGFDTHANQAEPHRRLLTELGGALEAWQTRLDERGLADEVVTLVFSEFGRRAAENRSAGTDHGTAGPVFVLGSAVRPGLHGVSPSLEDLDADGNLRFTVDLRRLQAACARDVLGLDPVSIVGDHPPLELFR